MQAQQTVSNEQLDKYAQQVLDDSLCVIPGLFDPAKIDRWNEAFLPLLHQHIEREGHRVNRGPNRYYVTLPFVSPFADPKIFENDVILGVVERLVGKDGVMCQLATDTPLQGSDYQEIHRDTQLLFPKQAKKPCPTNWPSIFLW